MRVNLSKKAGEIWWAFQMVEMVTLQKFFLLNLQERTPTSWTLKTLLLIIHWKRIKPVQLSDGPLVKLSCPLVWLWGYQRGFPLGKSVGYFLGGRPSPMVCNSSPDTRKPGQKQGSLCWPSLLLLCLPSQYLFPSPSELRTRTFPG